jgi:cytochrome c556
MSFAFKKSLQAIVFGFLISFGAATGVSAADEPENAAKYRTTLMKTLAGHMGSIGAVLKGEVSHAGHVKEHAQAIKAISVMAADVFPKGSDIPTSRAKPEIWQKWDEFLKAYGNFKVEAAKLAEVAAGGDLAAVGAQMGNVGKSCGGCHKPFRKEKK